MVSCIDFDKITFEVGSFCFVDCYNYRMSLSRLSCHFFNCILDNFHVQGNYPSVDGTYICKVVNFNNGTLEVSFIRIIDKTVAQVLCFYNKFNNLSYLSSCYNMGEYYPRKSDGYHFANLSWLSSFDFNLYFTSISSSCFDNAILLKLNSKSKKESWLEEVLSIVSELVTNYSNIVEYLCLNGFDVDGKPDFISFVRFCESEYSKLSFSGNVTLREKVLCVCGDLGLGS